MHGLTEEELKTREVVFIDIVNDAVDPRVSFSQCLNLLSVSSPSHRAFALSPSYSFSPTLSLLNSPAYSGPLLISLIHLLVAALTL